MRRLTVTALLVLVIAGCSTDSGGAGKPQVASEKPQATTTQTAQSVPPLEVTARQFVQDSNDTIGQDYTEHLTTYATPDCAHEMLKLGTTNTSSPTRLVSATQDGTTGTTITATQGDPSDGGATLHWTYTDRWRFTCQGIFQ